MWDKASLVGLQVKSPGIHRREGLASLFGVYLDVVCLTDSNLQCDSCTHLRLSSREGLPEALDSTTALDVAVNHESIVERGLAGRLGVHNE